VKDHFLLVRLLSAVLVSMISWSVSAELVVGDGYVREPIPGRSMSAAFMSISNSGKDDIVLTSVSLEGAGSVEIHTHSHQDGVMRMRQLHELTIKAGETVVLEPGGMHLMIFAIKQLSEQPKLQLCDQQAQCYSSVLKLKSLVK
jgi:hypothetical protein